MAVDYPDVRMSFRWGGKDGKWRWLTEVGDIASAGEHRDLGRAMREAEVAAMREVPVL